MASGNMGDLWFQLGVKDNTSKELQKIIEKLSKGEDKANDMLRAIQGFGYKKNFKEQAEQASKFVDILNTLNRELVKLKKDDSKRDEYASLKKSIDNALNYLNLLQRINVERSKVAELRTLNPNVDTAKLEKADGLLKNINDQLLRLQNDARGGGGNGVNKADILSEYSKALQMTIRDVRQLTSEFKRENPLSAFSGGSAKVEADIARVTEKLAKMRDLMSEGTTKGFNTSMLSGSITELDKVLARLQSAQGNKSLLTDAAQMKNLLSDVAVEMTKASAATQAYGREKGKVIAQDKEVANEYDRQKRQREASKAAQEAELKAMSDYAKRYMELQEVKRKADEKATADAKRESEKRTAQVQSDTRKMSELYSILGVAKDKAEKVGMNGLALNVDTSKLEAKLRVAEDLMNRIFNENVKTLGIGGSMSSSDYATEVRNVKRALDDATASQKELNRAKEQSNKTNKREAEKKAAQDARDAANAEKQRQSEIKKSESRYDALDRALVKLRAEAEKSVTLKVDTTKIDAKIHELESKIQYVASIMNQLKGGDLSAIGQLGGIGTGRDITLANRLLSSQAAANKEAAKGIEIEQKRQREIARSAAKARNDLASAFSKANEEAKKMQGIVGDIKSLFLQGGLVFGAQQFAMSIITTGGEMEKQHIALQSILGDMQNANTMFNQIKDLALNSPFTFSELNRDVKQLAAYGVEYDQLYDTTKRLADMSSGLGVSFDRIALAFGQVQARGWLDGKELRQIAYAGIPLLSKLSEFYSKREGKKVSTSEIKTRISKREVSFDDVKSIFWEMTDAGGQFYNMQQTLSETLLGRYNKLKDAWEIMLAEFASGNSLVGSFFKTALDGATALVQSLHSLAMPVGTLFAGYALKKMLTGNTASSFLSNKENMASNIQARMLQGQQISQVEQRILATKNQITGADLRALASARALTTEKLNQLRLSGQITAEQYRTYRGIVLRQTGEKTFRMELLRSLVAMRTMSLNTVWSNFSTSALAAFRIIGTGAKTLGATIWSAIGGLPGLIISAATAGVMYAVSEYQELSQKIKQTQDELKDRRNQVGKFLQENNVAAVVSSGDTKGIDNLIEAYKDKLKELAPYNFNNLVMNAEEKKSHTERLQYLENELKLLKKANEVAANKMSNRGFYSDLEDVVKDTQEKLTNRLNMRANAMMPNASQGDKDLYANEKAYEDYIEKLKDTLANKFGNIGKDDKMREAAQQAMSSIFSELGVPEDKADMIRASVLQAFGCGDRSSWLQGEVANDMMSLINTSFPLIGEKIKASIPLNEAEKAKVRELMDDAKSGLISKYPELERTLQGMLNKSRFQAVIELVVSTTGKLNDTQSEIVGRIPGMLEGEALSKYISRAEEYGKDNSFYSARNAAKTNIDNAFNNYQSAVKSKSKQAEKLRQEYLTEKQIAKTLLNYDYAGEGKKSNKPGKKNTGRQEDKELKALQERVSLYKKLYSEIKNYKDLFGNGALGQLANDGEFEAIFGDKKHFPLSDYTNYGTSIKELLATLPANTADRKNFVNREKAGIQTEDRKLLAESRSEELTVLNNQLSVIQEQYETYKKIYELTGNKKGAENVAFGGTVQFDSYKKFLEEQLRIAVAHDNVQSGLNLSASDVRGMDLENVKDKYGKESRTYDIRKQLDDEDKKIKSETIALLTDIIEKNATIAQQIEDENRKYERQLELIENIEDPQMKQRVKEGAEKSHNETTAKLQFEQFKDNSDWVTIFDDLNRVSSSTINSMIDKIDDFSKTTGLSVEVVKQLRDALGKLRNEQIERNPIEGIVGGMQRGNAIGSFIGSRFRKDMDISTTTYVGSKDAKKMGVKEGNYTKGQLENEQKGAYDDANKGIAGLANKFKSLQDCLSPVITLFDTLGMEDTVVGQGTEMASNALGAASQVSSGLSSLGLSSLGPYGAAAGAALSVVSSIAAMHDKSLQKEIEASEARQKEMENLTKNVKSVIESTLGGVYSYKATDSTKQSIKDAYSRLAAKQSFGNIFGLSLTKQETEAMKDLKAAMNDPNNAYASQRASLQAQKVELENQKSLEESKKKSDDTKIADYKQQITEMELQIKTFTEDFLKDIYSIDMKSWASDLTDAVVSAWQNGENAVDAYKDKVKEMVKDLTKNIITQRYIEGLMEKPLETLTKYLDDHNGKLDEGVILDFANQVSSLADEAAPTITKILDALKNAGLDLRENGSSSTTNSVKSITEDTADLLASYLNSIRLYCAEDNVNLKKMLDFVQGEIPKLSVISQAQLTQLNAIAQNTLRSADASERIESILNSVVIGTKYLHMK